MAKALPESGGGVGGEVRRGSFILSHPRMAGKPGNMTTAHEPFNPKWVTALCYVVAGLILYRLISTI